MKLHAWYHENPETLHIGTEKNRAYYLPFYREKGDRQIMLSGNDWAFCWFSNYLEVPQKFTEGNTDGFDTIKVPSCVNILGYEPTNMPMSGARFPLIRRMFLGKTLAVPM